MLKQMGKVLLVVAVTMLVALTAWSQAIFATLTGVVTDPTGAVVPQAKITLRNAASGDTRNTVADQQGYYTFASVPVGAYNLTVTQATAKLQSDAQPRVLAPLTLIPGLGSFLFKPMFLAVSFAMGIAYFLSRTFVPARAAAWLKELPAPEAMAVARQMFPLAPVAARAHAFLDHASPLVGSTVPAAPHEVVLTFTQNLEPAFSTAQVTDSSGARTFTQASDDGTTAVFTTTF